MQLVDETYDVYMVLPSGPEAMGDDRIEILRITGHEESRLTVPIH